MMDGVEPPDPKLTGRFGGDPRSKPEAPAANHPKKKPADSERKPPAFRPLGDIFNF
jgi:hypothetical protein